MRTTKRSTETSAHRAASRLVASMLVLGCFSEATGPGSGDAGTTSASGSTSLQTGSMASMQAESDADSSGASSDGMTADGTSGTSGTSGGPGVDYALAFHGASKAVTPTTDLAALEAEFTVEFWFRRTGQASGTFVDDRNPGDIWASNWWLMQDPDEVHFGNSDRLIFFVESDDCEVSPDCALLVGPDINTLSTEWHHFAATREASGRLVMWIDGALAFETTMAAPPVHAPAALRLGEAYMYEECPPLNNVEIDDLAISAAAKYTMPFEPAEPEADEYTMLLWHFDEGEGQVAVDADGVVFNIDTPEWVEGS